MKLKFTILGLSLFIWLMPLTAVFALDCAEGEITATTKDATGADQQVCVTLPPAPQNTGNSQTSVTLDNPLGKSVTNPTDLYARIIYGFMGVTGVVALLMFIIGGFSWMTAGGNQEKVKKGKDTLIWAVFGLVIIFSSYAILRAVFETLKF